MRSPSLQNELSQIHEQVLNERQSERQDESSLSRVLRNKPTDMDDNAKEIYNGSPEKAVQTPVKGKFQVAANDVNEMDKSAFATNFKSTERRGK